MGLFRKKKSPEEILAEGRALYERGDYGKASLELLKASGKEHGEVDYLLGLCYLNMDEKKGKAPGWSAKQYLKFSAKDGHKEAARLLAEKCGIRDYLTDEEISSRVPASEPAKKPDAASNADELPEEIKESVLPVSSEPEPAQKQSDMPNQAAEPAAKSAEACLLSLVPETGTLSPEFSGDITKYTLSVPFSVKTMSFSVEPCKGAVYRVNRKNLGAGGSDTDFLITVTAENGKTKQVYTVTVHRNEKTLGGVAAL